MYKTKSEQPLDLGPIVLLQGEEVVQAVLGKGLDGDGLEEVAPLVHLLNLDTARNGMGMAIS